MKISWWRLSLAILGFLALSIGLGYTFQILLARFHIPMDMPPLSALLLVLGILAVVNLSVLPLPFGVSIMLVAAARWNPILVALFGSLGASLGESSSYLFGYLGKRIAISEDIASYKLIQDWIRRYGMWAIAVLSFQPILPFEVGGFIAGIARMPVLQFLPALWIGKFPKYLILIYLGRELIHLIPSIRFG